MLKKLFLCALIFVAAPFLYAEHTLSSEDSKILLPLFKFLLQYSEAGYVFYDKKPMCSVNYFQQPIFFDQFEPYEQLSVAVYTAKKQLRSPLFHLGNIIFHFDEKEEMLLIINRKILLNTVQESLPLFQYVLGPTITPETLLEAILSSDKAFCEVLKYDRVLIGIVLGYGVQNALFASRLENMQYDETCILDTPPFAPYVHLCSDELAKKMMLFLDAEENPDWKKESKFHKPSMGFSSLQQERETLQKRLVIASERLTHVNPNFVFVCLPENQLFLRELEETQEKIRDLLYSARWFENTLEMISGEKIVINSTEQKLIASHNMNLECTLAKLLKHELLKRKYDNQYLSAFVQGLLDTDHENNFVNGEGIPPLAISSIRQAKKNLESADYFFGNLYQDTECIPILEPYLYYKIIEPGAGPHLTNEIDVSIDFEILDPCNNCLNTAR